MCSYKTCPLSEEKRVLSSRTLGANKSDIKNDKTSRPLAFFVLYFVQFNCTVANSLYKVNNNPIIG